LSSRAFGQIRVANELRKRGITVFGALDAEPAVGHR